MLRTVLNLTRLPGRLTAAQAAEVLGLTVDEVRILSSASVLDRLRDQADPQAGKGLLPSSHRLRAIGNPATRAVKFYYAAAIEKLAADPAWADRACRSLHHYWKQKKKLNYDKTIL